MRIVCISVFLEWVWEFLDGNSENLDVVLGFYEVVIEGCKVFVIWVFLLNF